MTKIDELQNLLATNISKVSDLVNKEEAKEIITRARKKINKKKEDK